MVTKQIEKNVEIEMFIYYYFYMIITELLNTKNEKNYQDYVIYHKNSVFYHDIAWKYIISDSYNHNSYYIIAKKNNKICGILPLFHIKSFLFGNFLVTNPFITDGGILADNNEIKKSLLSRSIEIAKELNTDFIKICDRYNIFENFKQEPDIISYILDTSLNINDIFKNSFNTKCRNQIRKSIKQNFNCKFGGIELLDDYIRVIHYNMRDLGSPFHGYNFHKNIFKYLKKNAHLCVIYDKKKPICSALLISHKNTISNLYASTLREYNKFCANNFLYYKIIEFTAQNNFSFFDFGRSKKNSSTSKFKKQWGGKEIPINYNYYLNKNNIIPEINPNNPKYKLLIYFWKKLPVFISQNIGHYIIKYIP